MSRTPPWASMKRALTSATSRAFGISGSKVQSLNDLWRRPQALSNFDVKTWIVRAG